MSGRRDTSTIRALAADALPAKRSMARPTVDFAQNADQALRYRIGKTIVDCLGFAACGDQTFSAHFRKMLRQGGLRKIHVLAKLRHRHLPATETAQHGQALVVRQQLEHLCGFRDLGLKLLDGKRDWTFLAAG